MADELIAPRPGNGIDRLLQIMERLRDPQSGCPWDIEQDFASIAPIRLKKPMRSRTPSSIKIG